MHVRQVGLMLPAVESRWPCHPEPKGRDHGVLCRPRRCRDATLAVIREHPILLDLCTSRLSCSVLPFKRLKRLICSGGTHWVFVELDPSGSRVVHPVVDSHGCLLVSLSICGHASRYFINFSCGPLCFNGHDTSGLRRDTAYTPSPLAQAQAPAMDDSDRRQAHDAALFQSRTNASANSVLNGCVGSHRRY